MAKKQSAKRPRRAGRAALAILLVLVTCALLAGAVNARTVRVEYKTAHMSGLDSRLDGVSILYVSDLKITTPRQARHAAQLIKRLCAAQPDILLIGGDICGRTLAEQLGIRSREQTDLSLDSARAEFILKMNELSVKYGIYAVSGDCDPGLSYEDERRSNIRFLKNEACLININGAALPIYGCAYSAKAGGYVFNFDGTGTGAMLVMCHDPDIYKQVALAASRRSSDPGEYLLLAGHGLGGQVRIGKICLVHRDVNAAYLEKAGDAGVYKDDTGLNMLLGQGIGSELIPFRLGSRPTAYYITLSAN